MSQSQAQPKSPFMQPQKQGDKGEGQSLVQSYAVKPTSEASFAFADAASRIESQMSELLIPYARLIEDACVTYKPYLSDCSCVTPQAAVAFSHTGALWLRLFFSLNPTPPRFAICRAVREALSRL